MSAALTPAQEGAYRFVDSLIHRADGYRGIAPYWHGWALRAAFEAGNAAATAQMPPASDTPIPMVLHCPACSLQHIDAPDKAHKADCSYGDLPGQPCDCHPWTNPPHRSHQCAGCRHIWRPADVATTGVAAITTKGQADSPPVDPRRQLLRAEREGYNRSLSHSARAWPGDGE